MIPKSGYRFSEKIMLNHDTRSRMIKFTINGRAAAVDADPDTPLLWIIRDHLGLTGVRRLHGACGRRRGAILLVSAERSGRAEDHHHRGTGTQPFAPIAAGLDQPAGAAMRILPEWND